MTIEALGGGTALTSTLAGLAARSVQDAARARSPDPVEDARDPIEEAVESTDPSSEEETAVEPIAADDIARSVAETANDATPTRLSVLYDQDIDLFISRRVDPESGEVVRQFLYEEHLERIRIFAEQQDKASGTRLDLRV